MVQSLERAFAILDEVAQRPAGVTAIAGRVRLPKSTVARLLATLEDVDAVERFDGSQWRIGPGVEALTAAASPEASAAAGAAQPAQPPPGQPVEPPAMPPAAPQTSAPRD